MFRETMPRLLHHMSRLVSRPATTTAGKVVRFGTVGGNNSRHYCSRRSRNLPVRSFFDDFWGGPRFGPFGMAGRMMDSQFRDMEKFMENMFARSPMRFGPFGAGRPAWAAFRPTSGGKEVELKYNDQIFEVKVDVSDYAKEDLNVRLAGDKLTISGKVEEQQEEHGFLSKEFSRQFLLPEDVDQDTLDSVITDDNYLVVRAKIKGAKEESERVINIKKDESKSD